MLIKAKVSNYYSEIEKLQNKIAAMAEKFNHGVSKSCPLARCERGTFANSIFCGHSRNKDNWCCVGNCPLIYKDKDFK
jgi:hypothetical protein